jgi:hypothetical protein
MKKFLFFISVLGFLFCKPTKTVYVNNVDGLETETFEAYNKGVHYEYGYRLTVYKNLILHDGKNYHQVKLSYTDDEYILADSVKDTPPLIYLAVNNIQGEKLYREEDLQNVIKILPFGYRVLFKSKFKKNWEDIYLVEYADSSFGYMKSENLKAQFESEYFKVATTLGLILREKPDQKSKQLDIIPLNYIGEVKIKDNTVLTIAGRKGNWILMDYNGKQGWVFSGFVYLSKYKERLERGSLSVEDTFNSLFEKVDVLKSFPILKKDILKEIKKDFKEQERPLIGEYSLRTIYYITKGGEDCIPEDSLIIQNKNKGLEYQENNGYYLGEFLRGKLYILNYQGSPCCCPSTGTHFFFLLKNKILNYSVYDRSYNCYWSVDEKCNLNFEKIKYSEKDSTLYLYSLFPDCSLEPNPDYSYDSIVKFKDYTKELFIAVKILEDDIVIKRFFDKSIPKEYLKSYEEAEQIKF